MRRAGGARLDALARRARGRRARRGRHALARPPPARARRDAGGARRRRGLAPSDVLDAGPRAAADGGPQPRRRASRPRSAYSLGRGVHADRRRSTTAASARSSSGSLAGGAAVTRLPAHDRRRSELLADGPDGVVLSNGPGDPAALDGEVATVRRAARPRPAPRDLPRPPAPRRRRRASRRSSSASATAARTTRCSSSRPAACSSPRRTTASRSRAAAPRRSRTSRSTTGRSRGSRFRTRSARSVQFHPEASPGPHDARPLIEDWVEGLGVCRKRPDLHSICLIGSGPIVIGQACEFDYAGSQALKVLRAEGFRTIVVNSNPATIMTDPGFADRTYLEPLDLEGVADVLRRERPDALLPTLGGQTALNLASELADAGILDELGDRADRRRGRRDPAGRGPRALPRRPCARSACACPESRIVTSPDDLPERPRRSRSSCARPSRSAATAAGSRRTRTSSAPSSSAASPRAPSARCSSRSASSGWDEFELEVMRDAQRQRRRRLLDREPRPDGRPHGRLGHGRAADDASGRGLPGAPRRGRRRHPRGRRRDRRLEHPVRARARDRRDPRDRDEPARLALARRSRRRRPATRSRRSRRSSRSATRSTRSRTT